jgi:phosphoglycerol transferase MdoB-like AlkP superfamily enzyme
MKSFRKDKSVLKKAIPVFFALCFLLVIILLFSLYLFLQSPSFPGYAERIINRYSPNPVEIGAVSFSRKHGLRTPSEENRYNKNSKTTNLH